MIASTKRDYNAHMESVKSGKIPLSQLHVIEIAKPPSQPRPPQLSAILADATGATPAATPGSGSLMVCFFVLF
jgi:hypothetical protein